MANLVKSTFRTILPIIVIVMGFGQLLRIPTSHPDFNIQALDFLILCLSLGFFLYQFLTCRSFLPSSWFSLLKSITLLLFALPWLFHLEWFSSLGAVPSLLYLLRFYACLTLVDVMAFSIHKQSHIQDILRAFLTTFGLIIIGGFIQYVLIPDFHFLQFWGWDNHLYRLAGQILDPGFTGLLLILGIIMIFPLLNFQPSSPSLWIFSTIFVSIISLALTFSRASYLAFAAALIAWGVTSRRFVTVIGLSIALGLAVALVPKPAGEGVNLARTSTVNFRLTNWYSALEIFPHHPLLGIGFDRYRYVQYAYGFLPLDTWQTSHSASGVDNSFLFLLVTTGLIGTLGFCTLMALVVVILWRQKSVFNQPYSSPSYLAQISHSLPQITLASLAAIFVHGMFHNSWFYTPVLVWICLLIGLTFKVGKLRKA